MIMTHAVRAAGFRVAAVVVAGLTAALAMQLYGRSELRGTVAEFEKKVGSLDLAEYAAAEVDPDVNSGAWQVAGARAFLWSTEDKQLVGRMLEWSTRPGSMPAGDRAALTEFLARSKPAFDLFAGSLEHDDVSLAEAYQGMTADLLKMMRSARAFAVQARLAMADGDWETVANDVAMLGRLADNLEREPYVIAMLIGVAAEKFQHAVIREAITEGADAATLARLAELVPENDLAALMRRALASEAAAGLAHIDGRLTAGHPMFQHLDESGGALEPLAERQSLAAIMQIVIGLTERSAEAQSVLLDELPKASFLTPAGDKMRANLIAFDGRVNGLAKLREVVRAALGARIERLENGAYPSVVGGAPDDPKPHVEIASASDGGLVVRLVNAVEYWPQIEKHEPSRTILEWRLP